MREWVRALSACASLSPARWRAKPETGSAQAKAQKKARQEFCEGFLNPEGQAAVVVDEAVLAYASGWYRASDTVATWMPNNTAHLAPGKTYGRGTGGVGDPRPTNGTGGVGDPRPTRWDGRGRRPAPNKMGRAGSTRAQRWDGRGRRSSRDKIAVTTGTFGLTVKLGSATFEFLFSTVPKSTKSIGGAPEGRQCAPLLGRRVSPSLAELTVVEPD